MKLDRISEAEDRHTRARSTRRLAHCFVMLYLYAVAFAIQAVVSRSAFSSALRILLWPLLP